MSEDTFNIKKNSLNCITGSGGKTSLIFYLARKLAEDGRVLVTTTTKIYTPSRSDYEKLLIGDKILLGKERNIDVAGESIDGEKLLGLEYSEIKKIKGNYDYILVEADGAKEKMLKGWKGTEPCIPEFADKTIGVVNIKSLEKKIDEKNIHRIDEFIQAVGEISGRTVDREVLERYISTGSFFRGSRGENIVYLNGVEKLTDLREAMYLGNKIDDLYIGSIWNGWTARYKRVDAVVMASGFSKRFEGEKLLTEVEGTLLLEYLLIKLKKLPFHRVMVVGRDKKVRDLASKYDFKYIENKKAHLGQSQSVKLGAEFSTGEGIIFFPGDQPMLTEESILKLLLEYQRKDEIVVPKAGGEPTSPVIFPRRYKEKLLKTEGDRGGKEVVKNAELISWVEFEGRDEFKDIDTREDLEEIRRMV